MRKQKIALWEEGSAKPEIITISDCRWASLRAGRSVTITKRGYAHHKYFIIIFPDGAVGWTPCGNLGGGYGRWEEA